MFVWQLEYVNGRGIESALLVTDEDTFAAAIEAFKSCGVWGDCVGVMKAVSLGRVWNAKQS